MAEKETQQLLRLAVEAENLEEVQRITSTLNITSLRSWTEGFHCLYNALNSGQIEIVKLLINKGCPVHNYSDGKILLNVAVIKGDEEIVQMLLRKGVNISSEDEKGMTALYSLAYRFSADVHCMRILDLIVRGSNINVKHRETGYTLLHYAAAAGNANIIRLLVYKKCHLDVRSTKGLTALHVSALNGHFQIASLLLDRGAKLNILTEQKETALCLAVQSGNIKTVEVLLNRTLRSGKKQAIVRDSLLVYHAAVTGKTPVVELLLLKGALVNAYSPGTGKTALHIACEKGNEDIVNLLLKKGACSKAIQESKTAVRKKEKSVGRTALHIAVEKEYEGIVNLLLQRGALPEALDELGRTPLHFAAQTGSLPIVTTLLRSNGNYLSMFTQAEAEGITPLHIAVENGSEDIVKLFLNNGIPVQMPTTIGWKSLHIAVQKQDETMIRLLLKYAADVNAAGKSVFETPLYLAAQIGNLKIVEILSEASPTRSSKWREAYFPLYIAAHQGHQEVVKMFLRNGVDPNAIHGKYLTPLHAAAHRGHSKVVELLLKYGAELDPKNTKSGSASTPLLAAIHARHEEIIFCLLDRGANVNVRLSSASAKLPSGAQYLLTYGDYSNSEIEGSESKIGFTSLHFAVESFMEHRYHRNLIQSLLKSDARVNIFSERGLTPLNIAVDKNLESVVGWLIAAGADVNIQDSILHTAILQKNVIIVKLLLRAKIDANAQSKDGNMALAIAVATDQTHMVQILLEADAVVNIDYNGTPILNIALSKKNIEISKMLLKAGIDINAKSKTNDTALSIAIKNDLEGIVRHLVGAGADVHVKWNGRPLLNVATLNENRAIMEMLLKAGVDANQKFDKDRSASALHVAVKTKNQLVVELLLKYGADVNLKFQNSTALCLAVEKNLTNICQILLEAGADANDKGLNNDPVLFVAIVNKNRAMVNLLLRNNALLNFIDTWNPYSRNFYSAIHFKKQYTPLHVAVSNSSVEVVELLLQSGSVVDIELDDFPLHNAIKRGMKEIVSKLLKYGAGINSVCKDGMTPLMHAVQKGSVEIVSLLLSKGAGVELETYAVASLLHFALDNNRNADIIKPLLDCGVDVNATSAGLSAIYRVLRKYNLHYEDNSDGEIDDDYNSDNEMDEENDYAYYKYEWRRRKLWHRYEEFEDEEELEDEEEGSIGHEEYSDEDDENENKDGNKAENQGYKEKSVTESKQNDQNRITYDKMEINQGNELETKEEENDTSGEETEEEPDSNEGEEYSDMHTNLLKLLLSYGANAKASTESNEESLLHLATRMGKSNAVEMLIQNGADVNFLDQVGNSPLACVFDKVTFDLNDVQSPNPYLLEHRDCARLIIKEIARLDALNKDITEHNQNLISSRLLKDFYARCQKEVEEMQNKKICSWLTFFDILSENRSKLAIFIKNKKVIHALETCDYLEQFPLYGKDLKARIREAKKRRFLLEKSVEPLKRVLRFKFPDIIVREVFSYLTTRDLRSLCISCDPIAFLKVEKCENSITDA